MKQCPRCNQLYPESSLNFCRNDGTPLLDNGSAPTVLISGRKPRELRFYFFIAGICVLMLAGGVFVWLTTHPSKDKGVAAPSVAANPENADGAGPVASGDWAFVTESDGGRIKVYYLRQGRTFKLKFLNTDATAEIRYKVRGDVRIKGEWNHQRDWHEGTLTVNVNEERLDNWALAPEVEEVSNVEVDIVDWNYK